MSSTAIYPHDHGRLPSPPLTIDDLCSPGYRAQLREMAEKGAWAGGGAVYAGEVAKLCRKCEASSLLDYGCGFVDMAAVIARTEPWLVGSLKVQSYDPGIPGREQLPEPADVVLCVDVLEHVEPDKVQNVLRHIHSLTIKCALIVIACKPAEKRLPDGRNAHLTIDNSGWWQHQLRDLGGWKARVVSDNDGLLHMWWRKLDTTNPRTLD
jgi:hypothetical protein